MAVKCVSLGHHCSFVVSEEKDDEAQKEWILKGGQPMNIKNGNDLRSKSFEIFVHNRMLFGDLWVMFMRRDKAYSAFPCYSTSFIDSLGVTKDETIDLFGGLDGIHKRYHSEILNAKYLVLVNEEKAEIEKEYVESNITQDGLRVFDGSELANANVKIPSNEKGKGKGKEEAFTVRIYVQPKKEFNFFLLKEFCVETI
eukprot:436717_1